MSAVGDKRLATGAGHIVVHHVLALRILEDGPAALLDHAIPVPRARALERGEVCSSVGIGLELVDAQWRQSFHHRRAGLVLGHRIGVACACDPAHDRPDQNDACYSAERHSPDVVFNPAQLFFEHWKSLQFWEKVALSPNMLMLTPTKKRATVLEQKHHRGRRARFVLNSPSG